MSQEQPNTPSLEQLLTVPTAQLSALFAQGQHDQLSSYFLSTLETLETTSIVQLPAGLQARLDAFVERFLFYFCQAGYIVSEPFSERFIRVNAVISNLVALSHLGTTDAHLKRVSIRPNNLLKVLTLYSARNRVELDIRPFYEANPKLTSLWYARFFDLYTSVLASEHGFARLKRHLGTLDERLLLDGVVNRLYFCCTYIDQDKDAALKQKINAVVRKRYPLRLEFDESHHNNKIAVVSGCWRNTHAVYKNQCGFIEALRKDYELWFYPLRPRQDTALFHHVDPGCLDLQMNLESMVAQKFRMIYFPDVGMTEQSVILANARLAPIQAASFGHSVSTHGADIDYYLVGEQVEDLEKVEENYSERLVVLPGLGITNKIPQIERRYPEPAHEGVLICCGWSAPKCCHPMLLTLKKVLAQTEKKVKFRFFAGAGVARMNGFLPFERDVLSVLGSEHAEVLPRMPYEEYMASMEECDFAVDSFHFGGCNTVIDALFLDKPMITRQGSKWYNRIGGAQLLALGFDDLVVDSEEAYIERVLRMIEDAQYRVEVVERIRSCSLLESPLFSEKNCQGFKKGIDYLMEHHETLMAESDRTPIRIAELK